MPVSMTDSMPRRHANAPLPQLQHREFDDRYRDLRRPRKVRFFVNGDRYFRGKKLYVTPNRYYNFNDLLNDLTGKLPSNLSLPYGVRQIFTPSGGRRVTDIFDLSDGESYVCAGFEGFKQIKYGKAELEPWSMAISKNKAVFQRKKDTLSIADTGSVKSVPQVKETEDVKVIQKSKLSGRPSHYEPTDAQQEPGYAARHRGYYGSNAFNPKRFFQGSVPHRKFPGPFGNASKNVYLNKSEGTQNKPKVVTIVRNGGKPRSSVKILLNRRSVQSFEQLVSDISEAFGLKWKSNKVNKLYTTRGREVQSISDFFREDDVFIAVGSEAFNEKNIHDIIEELYPDSPYSKSLIKEWDRHNKRRKVHAGPPQATNKEYDELKRDSGFAEGDDSNKDPDSTYVTPRNRGNETHRSKQSKQETYREAEEAELHTDREKEKATKDEKERSKKRQKMLESEKRALEEEKRRRGLVPLKPINDPFQKPKEQQEKERLEELQKVQEAEKKKKEEEEKKAQEEREKAVQAARDRQAAAEKAELEAAEKRKKESDDSKEKQVEEKKTEKEAEKETKVTEKEKSKEKLVLPKINEKEKDKENEKPVRKKRDKSKFVRKSKLERQVSSDESVVSKFDLGRTLGDGNFAIVRQAKMKSTNMEYALKIIDKPKLKGKEHMVENEIEIMKDCNHSNIVKLYEEYETSDKIYLLMEIVKGGDLFDAITQSVKFGEVDSASMVKDLCNALFYLHSRSIVHRDLKPENLLVHRNKDGTITLKLADFGLAMDVTSNIYTVCGTPTYVAPEILSEIGYGLEVDMWAVGVITYILLCGFPPFRSPDRNQTELFEFIKSGVYEFLSPYWDNISVAAKDLIKHLLIVDRKRRYTAIDVLSHPWITLQGDLSRVHDISKIEELRRATKADLENQAKTNLESYQKVKESRR